MRFTRWYPLADVAANAPSTPGVIQLRLAVGLLDYPRGKSAMVRYAVADDVRAAALQFAASYRGATLWCRHLDAEGEALNFAQVYAKLVQEFTRRFGSPPALPQWGLTRQ